ncbi:unnamed protein product [Paramecium pentaurelia]|uniref:Uncharacterized protein n=1 Tax=Paramecium pentaurelia TaxID=43138 RepID=A0A8S1SKE5_9CILI|nr:unnamed protein product [Paramecium pentaurelia]
MSIFHMTDISEKHSSYTSQSANKESNYQTLRSEVRTSIIDSNNHFEKLGQKKAKSSKGGYSSKESPRKYQNKLKPLEILFGKPPQSQEQVSQSSPAKISGLKKKQHYPKFFMMQQIGTQEQTGKFHLSTDAQDFKSTYYDQAGSKHSSLSSQSRYNQDALLRSASLTYKFYSERGTQLIEIKNLLELTPSSELQNLPRNYLDELQRLASSIQRNLKHHNDIRLQE